MPDSYGALWLAQQPAALVLMLTLFAGAVFSAKPISRTCLVGALFLAFPLGWEIGTVCLGGLPTEAGRWQPAWRWLILAAVLGTAPVPPVEPRLRSLLSALLIGASASWAPAIVALARGLGDGHRRLGWIGAVSVLALAGWVERNKDGAVASMVTSLWPMPTVVTTVAVANVAGGAEWVAWVAILIWSGVVLRPQGSIQPGQPLQR